MTRSASAALSLAVVAVVAWTNGARAGDATAGAASASQSRQATPVAKASADNIVFAVGGSTVRIPRVEMVGAGLSNTEVAALFATSDPAALEAKLRKLDAASVDIPEIIVDSTEGSTTRHFVQTQILLADVHDGRAAVASGARATLTLKNDNKTVAIAVGATTAKGIDLAALVHVGAATRLPAEPPRPLCDDLAVSAFSLSGEVAGQSPLTIATIRATGLKARPWKTGANRSDPASPLDAFDDATHSLSADLIEADDIALSSPPAPSTDGLKSLTVRRVALRGLANGRLAHFELSGFAAEGNDAQPGKLALSSASLDNLAGHGSAMPSVDRIALDDLALDVPTGDPGHPPTHVTLGVKRARYDAPGLVIGELPLRADLSIEHAAFDMPPDSSAAPILLAMGYRHIDLSGTSASRYDPPARTLNLDRLAVSGVGMGSLDLTLALADVSEAVVSQDDAAQKAAAEAMRITTIGLTLRNDGLIDKAIGFKAAIDGVTVVEERRNLEQLLDTGLVGFGLQGSAKAQSIVDALRRFLADPKTLHLKIGSKSGIGLDAIRHVEDPKAFIDALDVDAGAE